jgi:hypothetical protein
METVGQPKGSQISCGKRDISKQIIFLYFSKPVPMVPAFAVFCRSLCIIGLPTNHTVDWRGDGNAG